ncbi:hypothetical protein OUZ56_022717 [Daphnia magna]|uniref:Uncharacterized protein n=1 Tax=Daphnia magna TaxID=35525 RepID=A0ABR0AX87_9CRUS|nr:hypothetical protein OUZ56_022717 [Daphnia magna]
MTLNLLEMTLETRSLSCFVWTGTLEALMSVTNNFNNRKVTRNMLIGFRCVNEFEQDIDGGLV